MNYEEIESLKTLLARAEECINKSQYNEAETLANHVLAELEQQQVSIANQLSSEGELLRCSALIIQSTINLRRGDFQTALSDASMALGIAEKHAGSLLKGKALGNMGIACTNLSDYSNALANYEQALAVCEEINNRNGIASNLSNIGNVHYLLSDYTRALMYYKKSLVINEEIKSQAGIAKNLSGIGSTYRILSDIASALEYYLKALAINEEIGNRHSIAINLNSIGIAYYELSDYARALEYYFKALAINEDIGNKSGIAGSLAAIGNVYAHLSDHAQALGYYQQALAIDQENGDKSGVASMLGNIGNIYNLLLDYDNAIKHYQKALEINEAIGNKYSSAINLGNIGSVYADMENYERAEEYFHQALNLCEEIGAEYPRLHWLAALGSLYAQRNLPDDQVAAEKYLQLAITDSTTLGVKHITRDVCLDCYKLYKAQERWREALEMKELHETLKEEINVEEVKKQESIRQQQKEIELAKATADARHQTTMSILHKTLPPVIADRLIAGEKDIADRYESVSILFADIVGFTPLSSRKAPREVVHILNNLFSRFDKLTEKYGVERIKTIGDAYMIVSGAPEVVEDHAWRLAQTAFGMLDEIAAFNAESGENINLRIGLNSGEAIAAVVGDVKFTYDLWSDAVNTASRMESHGLPGKIHCTEDFVRALIPTFSHFDFAQRPEKELSENPLPLGEGRVRVLERGEIDIKGKGKMRTFYLEKRDK